MIGFLLAYLETNPKRVPPNNTPVSACQVQRLGPGPTDLAPRSQDASLAGLAGLAAASFARAKAAKAKHRRRSLAEDVATAIEEVTNTAEALGCTANCTKQKGDGSLFNSPRHVMQVSLMDKCKRFQTVA